MSHKKFSVAVVCSSNMNRSMAAHSLLREKGYAVKSFGVRSDIVVRAGKKKMKYSFDSTYSNIYNDLTKRRDSLLFAKMGYFDVLSRNMSIKSKPEMFQTCTDKFDIVLTCSKKCFYRVIDHFHNRTSDKSSMVHVVNFEIYDNPFFAEKGAKQISYFMSIVDKSKNLDEEIRVLIKEYEKKTELKLMYGPCFY